MFLQIRPQKTTSKLTQNKEKHNFGLISYPKQLLISLIHNSVFNAI